MNKEIAQVVKKKKREEVEKKREEVEKKMKQEVGKVLLELQLLKVKLEP